MRLLTLLLLPATACAVLVYHLIKEYRRINPRWRKLKEWADQYGKDGFYRTEMMGARFIIVTDETVAEELLVRRAKLNSDRPAVTSLFDSKSDQGSMEYLPLMGKNVYWARQRKIVHAYLTEAAKAAYHGIMYFEVKRLVAGLIHDPDNFQFLLEDMASKVMCQLTWDDPSLSEYCTKSAWGLLTQMSPAGPITNLCPLLWHLPMCLNPWKWAEKRRHDEQQRWWMAQLQRVRDTVEKGEMRPCWTRQFLETKKTSISGDHEASCMLGMMALVGIFTVAGPLTYFLVAMIHHPQWQSAVQKEVDEICKGRPPTLDDTPNLPILRACIKETMRWRPNVPTGVAHETEEDYVFCGYYIPKGTRILPLEWSFLRNPAKYPDPDNFRPERWLEPAWCFNLLPKTDPATGDPIPVPTDDCNSLLIIKPNPFQMKFEPRSEERRHQALKLWYEAEAKDREERQAFVKQRDKCNSPGKRRISTVYDGSLGNNGVGEVRCGWINRKGDLAMEDSSCTL
ncbi:hypothetical protein VTK73DRAFT_6526 [Phialemonium thermophilum]|uniref:Cytochrome P450 n=1 Tax=Phialemonium thermophilum TaxID=223376 RepID=A0ABR3XVB6_9PEZI